MAGSFSKSRPRDQTLLQRDSETRRHPLGSRPGLPGRRHRRHEDRHDLCRQLPGKRIRRRHSLGSDQPNQTRLTCPDPHPHRRDPAETRCPRIPSSPHTRPLDHPAERRSAHARATSGLEPFNPAAITQARKIALTYLASQFASDIAVTDRSWWTDAFNKVAGGDISGQKYGYRRGCSVKEPHGNSLAQACGQKLVNDTVTVTVGNRTTQTSPAPSTYWTATGIRSSTTHADHHAGCRTNCTPATVAQRHHADLPARNPCVLTSAFRGTSVNRSTA